MLALLREIETGFYLTGGTAASRGYLNHRFSDDLDLFVNDDRRFGLWADRLVAALTSRAGWTAEVTLREERFVRINLDGSGVLLKLELVDDVPAHVGRLTDHPILFRLDSAENILANKLTALVDRSEPKDLADVWGFCCKVGLSLEDALVGAQSKAAGLFAPTSRGCWCKPASTTGAWCDGSTRRAQTDTWRSFTDWGRACCSPVTVEFDGLDEATSPPTGLPTNSRHVPPTLRGLRADRAGSAPHLTATGRHQCAVDVHTPTVGPCTSNSEVSDGAKSSTRDTETHRGTTDLRDTDDRNSASRSPETGRTR